MLGSKVIVLDVDGTIATDRLPEQSYADVLPVTSMCEKLVEMKKHGWRIILYTSRSMRTYQGNVGEINVHAAPILIDWLKRYQIPHDELHFGKPWCGFEGYYVDDRALRPREFLTLTPLEISNLIEKDKA
jgi:capsule biosynthesis phosphatase